MQTIPKLYLTGMLVLDMAMMNYCYNTYGLSPDYSFFETNDKAVYVESVAADKKAHFISNYTPVYDNIISGMAIMDDSISTGALFTDLRSNLGTKLYIDDIHIQVPGVAESIGGGLEVKTEINYAGDAEAGKIYRDGLEVAEVRIKNGMFYRLSSHDPAFKVGDVHVGMNITEICRMWGVPTFAEPPVYRYPAGKNAQITLMASTDGFITWMLYESTGTMLISNVSTTEGQTEETTASAVSTKAAKEEDERSYPVAEAGMRLHGTHNGGKDE